MSSPRTRAQSAVRVQLTRATVQGGFGVVQVQVTAEDRRRALGHSVNASEDGFSAVPGPVDQQPRDFAWAQPDGVFGEVGHVPRPVQARAVVRDVERCDASGACGDAAGVTGGGLHEHVVRRPLFGQRAGLVEVSRGEVAGARIGGLPACDAFTYDEESAAPVRDCGLFQHRVGVWRDLARPVGRDVAAAVPRPCRACVRGEAYLDQVCSPFR